MKKIIFSILTLINTFTAVLLLIHTEGLKQEVTKTEIELRRLQDEYIKSPQTKFIKRAEEIKNDNNRSYMNLKFGENNYNEKSVLVLYVSPYCDICWEMWTELVGLLEKAADQNNKQYELHLRFAPANHALDLQTVLILECAIRSSPDMLKSVSRLWLNELRTGNAEEIISSKGLQGCVNSKDVINNIISDINHKQDYGIYYVPLLVIDDQRYQGFSKTGLKIALKIRD